MKNCMLLLFMVWAHISTAQNWRSIGPGTIGPTSVQALYGDEVVDRLLCGGTFRSIRNDADTVLAYGLAAWNGERWDSIAHRIAPAEGQTAWFLRFEGRLFAIGNWVFPIEGGGTNTGFAWLDETSLTWEPLECVNPDFTGMANLVPVEPQGTMYATGFVGSICGYPESCVFRYDGEQFHIWEPFQQIPSYHGNYVGTVFDFQGKTYMTGSVSDPLGNGLVTFLRFNGTTWEHVPGWNTQSPIKSISIRNDTLYVAGAFRLANGGPGNLIARFDGENWDDMAGGMLYTPVLNSSIVSDLEWYHGELYACGLFTTVAGIPADGIAKWNGQQWCVLPGEFNGSWGSPVARLADMTVWRDSLYVCGGFFTIDGEPFGQVAQWIGGDVVQDCSAPVGVTERIPPASFTLHPNPTTGLLHVELNGLRPRELWVSDALGRVVLRQALPGTAHGPLPLDLGALSPGAYLVTVLDAEGMRYTQRVVRE